MDEILVGDIGGTHARFAIAAIDGGRVAALGEAQVYRTADFPGLQEALATFAAALGRRLPRAASLAVASPIGGDAVKLTNNPWTLRPERIGAEIAPDGLLLVNDFGAVARAVAVLGPMHLRHVCGPDTSLPGEGPISVIGPGTGLGVAQLLRRDGRSIVVETEGGHVGFCPRDAVEDALLAKLRARHGRVSVERILSGPGLAEIHAVIGGEPYPDDAALWRAAMDAADPLAAQALDRFCRIFGAVAGDFALGQGAVGVALAGGVGARLAERLPASGFAEAFIDKGRFRQRMAAIPVRLVTHPQPGLLGAAATFAGSF